MRLIEYANVGLEPLIKLADAFGIAWHCLFDGDSAGQNNAKKAATLLNGRSANAHMSMLKVPDIEHLICNCGYGAIYEQNVSPQKINLITTAAGHPDYWSQVLAAQSKGFKVSCVLKVAEQMAKAGPKAVPTFVRELLESTIRLGSIWDVANHYFLK